MELRVVQTYKVVQIKNFQNNLHHIYYIIYNKLMQQTMINLQVEHHKLIHNPTITKFTSYPNLKLQLKFTS